MKCRRWTGETDLTCLYCGEWFQVTEGMVDDIDLYGSSRNTCLDCQQVTLIVDDEDGKCADAPYLGDVP